ncbi:hypothetical protein Tco_0064051 [Tanacetum coccineum]
MDTALRGPHGVKSEKSAYPYPSLSRLLPRLRLVELVPSTRPSLHTASNMWIRNLVIRNLVGDLQLGIESYQTKINLEHPNWDAADYYFKEDYTIVPKQEQLVSKRWRWRWIFPVPEMSSVKASANSDVMYSFTSAQDGNPLQDDVRLCLGDDLKKAQDHSQRQAGDLP